MRSSTTPRAGGKLALSVRRVATAVLVALIGASSCSRQASDSAEPTSSKAPAAAVESASPSAFVGPKRRGRPKVDRELPTTTGHIAEGNLDAQVNEAERLLKLTPPSDYTYIDRSRSLVSLHLGRGIYRNDLSELQVALGQITACADRAPKDAKILLDRASVLQSLHRFPAAREDAERARTLGATEDELRPISQELEWQQGNYETSLRLFRASRERRRTLLSVAREAVVEDELGNHDVAERLFEEAEDLARDTSPFPVAWLNVQRGIQRAHIGKLEEAIVFFREAAQRLPKYQLANQHLAEMLQKVGQEEEAIRIFEELMKTSKNPGLAAGLSKLYRSRGRVSEADALVARAKAGYEELLVAFPEAMAWHAAEFFRGVAKEPERAVPLLKQNAALRPNSTAYVALARAQLGAGDVDGAKASIDKSLAMPLRSAALYWVAARVYERLGDARKSEEYDRQAREENPKVDQDFCACR